MQKARCHTVLLHSAPTACKLTVSVSISLPSRGSFHLSLTVLVHYRSSSSIQPYGMVPTHSHEIPRASCYSGYCLVNSLFAYWTFTIYGVLFQNTSTKLIKSIMQSEPCMYYYLQFGLFLFRSPLLQESNIFFLFLWVLRCFSSPRSLLIYYFTHIWILRLFALSEFPHSDISGLMDICSYPKLFAAYHVLLRLLVPSYSPYALCSLTLFSLLIINMFNIISIINRFNCILQFLTTI